MVQHLFDALTPVNTGGGDTDDYTLGIKFSSAVDGFITAIRFLRIAAETQTSYDVGLWQSSTLLASKTITGVSGTGWIDVVLDTPIPITASTEYVAGVTRLTGYPYTSNFFAASAHTVGDLTAALSTSPTGLGNGNGVFTGGSTLARPTSSFSSTNYFIDVSFETSIEDVGTLMVFNGTLWVPKPVKVWNGSAWVTKPIKRWNGTAWV